MAQVRSLRCLGDDIEGTFVSTLGRNLVVMLEATSTKSTKLHTYKASPMLAGLCAI